jgi:hypothetical protein
MSSTRIRIALVALTAITSPAASQSTAQLDNRKIIIQAEMEECKDFEMRLATSRCDMVTITTTYFIRNNRVFEEINNLQRSGDTALLSQDSIGNAEGTIYEIGKSFDTVIYPSFVDHTRKLSGEKVKSHLVTATFSNSILRLEQKKWFLRTNKDSTGAVYNENMLQQETLDIALSDHGCRFQPKTNILNFEIMIPSPDSKPQQTLKGTIRLTMKSAKCVVKELRQSSACMTFNGHEFC